MLWLLYGSAVFPLHGNCLLRPIGCQTDEPCLGWMGEKEAVPWSWDVLSSPCPMEKAEERCKGKGGVKTFLSQVVFWLCRHYQCL